MSRKKRKIRFHVGDNVQVVGRSPEDDTWCSAMDKTIGGVGEVIEVEVDDDYVLVEVPENGSAGELKRWWYHCYDLTDIKSDELDNVSPDDVMGFFD